MGKILTDPCSMGGGVLRKLFLLSGGLVCFGVLTALAGQPPVKAAPVPVSPADSEALPAKGEAWHYARRVDKVRNFTARQAELKSGNPVMLDFPYNGGSRASILLQKVDDQPSIAVISISKGQFDCGSGCQINVTFDKTNALNFEVRPPSYGPTDVVVFTVEDSKAFIARLAKANMVTIEAPFFSSGRRKMTFSVAGLDWK
jgi:hypothetical protein